MDNTEVIIKFLPKIYLNIIIIEDQLSLKNEHIKLNISEIYNELKNIFGNLPNELASFKIINDENIYTFKNLVLTYTFKQSINHLKSVYTNTYKFIKQMNSDDIKNFLHISSKFNIDIISKSLLYIFLSELCRISDPVFSFNLIIKAFEIKPDIALNLGMEHLKNFIYNVEIFDSQKRIEKCPVCGGKGYPFHNSPCYKMINYNKDFLPSKLWLKCNKCNNLFTQYFPSKFLNRNNTIKIINPENNTSHNLNNIPNYILCSWCDILNNIKQFTNGKNILEIGVGTGAFISVALEMDYNVDCVEIEKYLAQDISNLLNHKIICCNFLDLPENKKYDIISMGDVLEHLEDPKLGLEKSYRLLNNNGILWISTPNYMSSFNRLYKTHTSMWNEPWHITYFFKNGLESLLDSVGFNILNYKISNHYNGSMEIIVNKKIKG